MKEGYNREVISLSESQTRTFGRDLAATLRNRDVVALYGSLGTGKTVLVKGICEGLGVTEAVTSPTFTLVQLYEGREGTVTHIDAYRLHPGAESEELSEPIDSESIVLIEWAERVGHLLPERRVDIVLNWVDEETRKIDCHDKRGITDAG